MKGLSKLVITIVIIAIIGGAVATLYTRGGQQEGEKESIKIGLLNPMTGPVPSVGHYYRNADLMAIHDINNSKGAWSDHEPGVLGRSLEPVYADSECNPSAAIEKLKRLKFKEGVELVTGTVSSGVAKGVMPTLSDLNILLSGHGDSSRNLNWELYKSRSKKNEVPLYFVQETPVYPDGATAATIVKRHFPNAEAVIGVGPNYIYGFDMWGAAKSYLRDLMENGIIPEMEFKEPIYPALGTKDYSSAISKLQTLAKEQKLVVISSFYGSDSVTFLKQAATEGLFEDLYGSIFQATGMPALAKLKTVPSNFYGQSMELWSPLYPQTKKMENWRNRYRHRFGERPTGQVVDEYVSVIGIAHAIEKANSTKAHKVARALQTIEFDVPWTHIQMRKINNSAIVSNIVYGKVGYNEEWDQVGYVENQLHVIDGKKLIKSAEAIKELRKEKDVPPGPY